MGKIEVKKRFYKALFALVKKIVIGALVKINVMLIQ